MVICGLLWLAMLAMKFWPETPAAKGLRAFLIERPAQLLKGIKRRHVILLVVGLAMLWTFTEIGAPHLAMAAAVDVSAYLDTLLVVWTVAALNRSRGAWAATMARVMGLLRPAARSRQRRHRTANTARPQGSNDDDHPGHAGWDAQNWALAA